MNVGHIAVILQHSDVTDPFLIHSLFHTYVQAYCLVYNANVVHPL